MINGGFIDRTGKEIISLKYDDIYPDFFENGRAYVRDGERWFYIDKEGNEIK